MCSMTYRSIDVVSGSRRRHVALAAAALLLTATSLPAVGVPAGFAASGPAYGGAPQAGVRFNRDDPISSDPDNLDFDRPAEWRALQYYDVYENLFLGRGDPNSGRAVNINTVGEVPDSSWFANRLGVRDMSLDALVTGPNLTGGPAAGTWRVIGRPAGGITPKFLIEDSEGSRFVLKFDPASYPELASAAEMVCSKLFYAFGFHVAEAYVVNLSPDRLQVAPGADFTNDVGEDVLIEQEDITYWLRDAPRSPDGTLRALASRFLPGEQVGEFRFFGTRSDDPNDIFPHENRRELRGYRAIAAWTNHDDSRATNTYDAYVEENGRRFIRHYVLDFGSCLGSASIMANKPRGGNEYFLEGPPTWKTMFTLGLWSRPYLRVDYADYPAIGNIEADYFQPERWKQEYPNAAFARMDAADAFWAARIISRFSDEAVRAIVETAEISDPLAARYLAEVIIQRRDKVVAYRIVRTNPLDGFEVAGSGSSRSLRFDNAAIRLNLASDTASYGVRWYSFDNSSGERTAVGDETDVLETAVAVPSGAWGSQDQFGYRYAQATISTRHVDFPDWTAPVTVTLRDISGAIDIVGLVRPR